MLSHPLILASRSPRRRELLENAGYVFEVVPARDEAEDQRRKNEPPTQYVLRLARQKAEDVALRLAGEAPTLHAGETPAVPGRKLVLGCDTIVVCRDTILGKPLDRNDAARMLRLLRGTRHSVITGVCLYPLPVGSGEVLNRCEETILSMSDISDTELQTYLDTNLWQGKAGAFGYQDRNDWIRIETGSESNVVGLPLELLHAMLQQ